MTYEEAIQTASASSRALRSLWDRRASGDSNDDFWKAGFGDGTESGPVREPFSSLAAAALGFGEVFLALDLATEGKRAIAEFLAAAGAHRLASVEMNMVKIMHAYALAQARLGSTDLALAELASIDEIFPAQAGKSEVTGLRGRIHKDLAWTFAAGTAQRRELLQRACAFYREGYASATDSAAAMYLGVNAAATARLAGNSSEAIRFARKVLALAGKPGEPDYWWHATVAEAHLIEGRLQESANAYRLARDCVRKNRRWADLASTRRQAKRLCDAAGHDFTPIDAVLDFPRLAVFSGHMVDAPDRGEPRFPDSHANRAAVRSRIREFLDRERVEFAVGSGACGADLLFIEEMVARGGEVHVVIPWPRDSFVKMSVSAGGSFWEERFKALMEQVSSVTQLTQQTAPDPHGIAFEFCNRCLSGLALHRARAHGAEIVPFAVWDGRAGGGPGGTESFVRMWQGPWLR